MVYQHLMKLRRTFGKQRKSKY